MVASKDSSALQASLGDELNQLGPAPAKGAFAITARLRQAIESGVFAHGDQLPPERQLTLALGTARSTIRKALDTLVQEGLVVRRVGSGTFVNYAGPIRPTSDDIADLINPLQLIEVRTAVEPAMVRLAVLNATRRDLTEIEAALDKLEASTRDPDQFTRWDIRFHLELARCSRNPLMVHIYEEINDVRAHPQWDRMKSIVLTTETMQQYNVEHRAIFGAIRDHDTVTAVDAITRHLERAKQHLIGAENADGNIEGKAVIELTQAHRDAFDRDGFVIVENVLDEKTVLAARDRFEPLFSGKFETGLYPDEWNWKMGRDREDVTRQICNGWKSDRTVASIVLREDIGKACATLRGWPGARINQDNVIWKPPGTKPLGFHQDDSYQTWITPAEMMTCWIPLDDTRADQGTIEYVRGSHKWPLSPPIKQFHAPDDPLADLWPAAEGAGVKEPEIIPIEIKAGWAVFHHGRTRHGSRDNRGKNPRRAVISHCMSSDAKFHPTNVGYIYSRYKQHGSLEMDESFFPVLWRKDGYRTPWLDEAMMRAA